MSFRRYVGKTVHVRAQDVGDGQVEYISRLFDYDDAGIWLHHSGAVTMPSGRQQNVDGLMFIPHDRIYNVFAFDGLDEMMADELKQQEMAGAAREAASEQVIRARQPADKAFIDQIGKPEEQEPR